MLDLLTAIQGCADYLDRALPKGAVMPTLTNAERVEAFLALRRRAVSDPVARVRLERAAELIQTAYQRKAAQTTQRL